MTVVDGGAEATVRTEYTAARDTYRDAMELTLPTASDHSALDWIRAVIEQSPLPLRRSLPPGWWLLGMRLAPTGSPDHVHGWPIEVDRPDEVVLAGPSKLGFDARLIVEVDGCTVRFRSEIRHRNRVSYRLWQAIGPAHRALIALMLRHAARAARELER